MFTLNIGFEFEQILLLISLLMWAVILVASRKALVRDARLPFLLTLIFLPSYLHWKFFIESDYVLATFGVFDIWFRHLSFYIGQFFFFLFVTKLLLHHVESAERAGVKKTLTRMLALFGALFLAAPSVAHAIHTVNIFSIPKTPYNILLYLTDQGVQHILVAVFFLINVAIVRAQALYAEMGRVRRAIFFLFAGNACFLFLHMWEYITESLHLLSIPHELVESIEWIFQYAGMIMLYVAVTRFLPALERAKKPSS